ncbi:MAG: oligosaccharide flippase family protein [Syntrophobacterales bacterium]|nr:oligosaccharide flippase family protein [Syntrophobacterales bacterium]
MKSVMRHEKAALLTFITSMIINLCNVGTGILTARILLPEGRGELATIILWPSILAGLGLMGTNWSLAREIAAHPEKEGDLSRTSLSLSLLLAFAAMALGYYLLPHLLPADKQHLLSLNRFYLLWIPLNFVALHLLALDQGTLRWWSYNLVRLAVVIPYLLCLIGFWLARIYSVAYFVVALLLSNLLAASLRVFLQWRAIVRGRVSLSLALTILRKGLPYFLAAAAGVVALQMDKALVVSWLSTQAVGLYAVAFSFASAHASLAGALGTVSFAALANEPDRHRQGQFLAKVFRQACWLYLAAGAGVALLAPVAIVPLFGREFAPAIKPAVILTLATSVAALGKIIDECLRGVGQTHPGIVAQFVNGGLMALAASWLIPSLGLTGMAAAAVAGALAQLLVLLAGGMALFGLSPAQFWGFRRTELQILCQRFLTYLPKKA